MSIEEEERMRRERDAANRARIAQSRAQQVPLGTAQPIQAPIMAGGGQNPLQQIGMKLLGGVLGGIFNEGGKVPMQGYNQGGNVPWWKRAAQAAWGSKAGKKGSFRDQTNWGGHRRNMGGPISMNPYGYNEGGQAMETPLKKVMEEDKIELARMAAMRAEQRKDKKFEADERRAQQKFNMEMKMKKAAATTKKAPLASKK